MGTITLKFSFLGEYPTGKDVMDSIVAEKGNIDDKIKSACSSEEVTLNGLVEYDPFMRTLMGKWEELVLERAYEIYGGKRRIMEVESLENLTYSGIQDAYSSRGANAMEDAFDYLGKCKIQVTGPNGTREMEPMLAHYCFEQRACGNALAVRDVGLYTQEILSGKPSNSMPYIVMMLSGFKTQIHVKDIDKDGQLLLASDERGRQAAFFEIPERKPILVKPN